MKKNKDFKKLNELSSEEMSSVISFVNESLNLKSEIKGMQESFNETLTSFCEEKELDKKALRKVINLTFKLKQKDSNVIDEEQEILDTIIKISEKI